MTGLIDFTQLNIPRWIGLSERIISNEIHVFGDASEAAYGAVVKYLHQSHALSLIFHGYITCIGNSNSEIIGSSFDSFISGR